MDERTLKALKGSIRKWERIIAGTGTDDGVANCPLCLLFHDTHDDGVMCEGCPVREKTGRDGCSDTPYDDWYDNKVALHEDERTELDAKQTRIANAELAFLKSLLP